MLILAAPGLHCFAGLFLVVASGPLTAGVMASGHWPLCCGAQLRVNRPLMLWAQALGHGASVAAVQAHKLLACGMFLYSGT